jgi:hypothetical protein
MEPIENWKGERSNLDAGQILPLFPFGRKSGSNGQYLLD